ncbi:hypothetical protein niasHT_018452 [Heterodera trifolii]|uniref:RING-type domain-containing protein n=1 Tax=Heterodera trifolii TaxID=157864 RepID=A0ABD2KWN6_9BILA
MFRSHASDQMSPGPPRAVTLCADHTRVIICRRGRSRAVTLCSGRTRVNLLTVSLASGLFMVGRTRLIVCRASERSLYPRRSARLRAPGYRPLFRVVFHHSSTTGNPVAERRKQQRRSKRRCRQRLERQRLRAERQPFWRLLDQQWADEAHHRALGESDWLLYGDQLATARDVMLADGRPLDDWLRHDETVADWTPLDQSELKRLSDGVHRTAGVGAEACPICMEPLADNVLLCTGCCGQRFCSVCLWTHACQSRACPLCRRHLLTGEPLTVVAEDVSGDDNSQEDYDDDSADDGDDHGGAEAALSPPQQHIRPPRLRRRHGPATEASCSGFGTWGSPSSNSTEGSFVELAEWADE